MHRRPGVVIEVDGEVVLRHGQLRLRSSLTA
jgi:hypothetical protein